MTTVHITGGNEIGAESVYPMELLAILATLQLSEHVKDEHETSKIKEIVTDALGACKIANKLQLDPHMQATYTPLFYPLTHMMRTFEGTLRWTTAHAELRNSLTENWSRDDCLNHVADKVAGGSLESDIDTAGETNHIVSQQRR